MRSPGLNRTHVELASSMHAFLQTQKKADAPSQPAGPQPTFNDTLKKTKRRRVALPSKIAAHSSKANSITVDQAKQIAKYAPQIQAAARKHRVPVELICGVILQESGGNPRAVSPAGARGLMQLMPATAKRMGVQNSHDATQNIDGGANYLRQLLDRYDGNVELALAGYNAGEANVDKHGGIPPFRETRAYVPRVLAYSQEIQTILRASSTDAAATDITTAADPLPAHSRRA